MNLKATIIGATLRKITGKSNVRIGGFVHGVVVSDAYGNKPTNVWMPGTSGVSMRTDRGEVVRVFVRHFDLMPALALGWGIGDTLTIRGRMRMQGATLVFHDAVVRVTSQHEIKPDRLNGAYCAERNGKLNSGVNRRDKVNSRVGIAFFRSASMCRAYDLVRTIARRRHSSVRKKMTCISNP